MNFWDFQAREFPIPRLLLGGTKSSGSHLKKFVLHMNNIPTTRTLLFGTGDRTGTRTHLAIRTNGIYLVTLFLVSGLVFG